jgi:hypothetical protein
MAARCGKMNTPGNYRLVASAIDLELAEDVGRDEGIAAITAFLKVHPEKIDVAVSVLANLEPKPPPDTVQPPPPQGPLAQLFLAVELEFLYAITSETQKRWLWAHHAHDIFRPPASKGRR